VPVAKKVAMKHRTPRYRPWDGRLCAVPNGALFKALSRGDAPVVTDHIDHFTETGIQLKSGEHLDADIVVSATGLDLQLLGNASLSIDDKPVDLGKAIAYRSLMFNDIPNAAMIFGYTNSSWTLKADIGADYICRVINHMDEAGLKQCTPRLHDPNMETLPFLDFNAGYVQRALAHF